MLALAICVGCAVRHVDPAQHSARAEADILVRTGCFSCLQDALARFEELAISPDLASDAARGAFTTSILLTVRARELGLADDHFLRRAHLWSTRLATSSHDLSPTAYFDALALIQGETSGFPPEERRRRGAQRRSLWPTDGSMPSARKRLSARPAGDLAAEYLALAIDCEDAQARKRLSPDAVYARHPFPLIRFRLGLCARDGAALQDLHESDARWVDTLFFRGQIEMSRYPAPDLVAAAGFFSRAHERFPRSDAVALALAHARNALREYAAALRLFDEVLLRRPEHGDALFGRVLSLSYLNRHVEAIDAATRLIDAGDHHVGDARYWRAWNRYRLHHLPAAWDDIRHAAALSTNSAVSTLAGFIAYARQWPVTAIARLREAHRLDSSNCEAVWTEGLVHVDKEDWMTAGRRFAVAADCFGAAAESIRRETADTPAGAEREAARVRRIAAAQKDLETAEYRRAQSAFNAASSYARAGDTIEALAHLRVASSHPKLKEKAQHLAISWWKN